MSKKVDLEWTPSKVDKFLQQNYSLSLYHFAYSLSDILAKTDVRKRSVYKPESANSDWREFWSDRIRELESLKNINQKSREILEKFWDETERFALSDSFLNFQLVDPELELEIKDISKPIDYLVRWIDRDYLSPTRIKGKPADMITILFLVWSHFIRDEEKDKCHVLTLLTLLKWFSIRINDTNLGEIDPHYQYNTFEKKLNRYKRRELKTVIDAVEEYKVRFLVPVRQKWLEESIRACIVYKYPSLIIFSNNEILKPQDCLRSSITYKEYAFYETVLCHRLDFRPEIYIDETAVFDEQEEKADPISEILILEEKEEEENSDSLGKK